MFVNMPAPEQFLYYLLLMKQLITERADLGPVYIDFGCRLGVTWLRWVQQLLT